MRLSPRDPAAWTFVHHQAFAYLGLGRYEEAVAVEQQALRTPNAGFWPYVPLVSALGHLDRREESERAIRELLRIRPGYSRAVARRQLTVSGAFLERIIEGLANAGLPE